jgi:hypothetical protein
LNAVGIKAGVVLVPGHAYTWFEKSRVKYALEGTAVGNEVSEGFFQRPLNESLGDLTEDQYQIIDPAEDMV